MPASVRVGSGLRGTVGIISHLAGRRGTARIQHHAINRDGKMARTSTARPMIAAKGDPQLADLRAFAAVCETGSFSRAAEALGISQPTVSTRVQNLEEHLGFRLIDRRQGSVLTEMGRPIYARVTQTLAQIDAFNATAQGLEDLQTGFLRIGFSTPPQAMSLIGAFRREWPGIRLSLSQSNTWGLLEDLRRQEIDIAIMTMAAPPPEPQSHVLIERQRLAAMVPVGHPLTREGAVTWKRLIGEPLLMRRAPSMTRTQIDREFARHGISADPFLDLPSREAIKEAVASGLGVGLAFASETGADARITSLPIRDAEEGNCVYAVGPASVSGLPAVASFMAIARTAARA